VWRAKLSASISEPLARAWWPDEEQHGLGLRLKLLIVVKLVKVLIVLNLPKVLGLFILVKLIDPDHVPGASAQVHADSVSSVARQQQQLVIVAQLGALL